MPPVSVPPNYRVERMLGSGQTSHVYLAQHEHYGSLALKLLREDVRRDPVLSRMFENEVQLTLALSHPNVITAFEGFPTGPGAYLALEYCPGGTLDEVLTSGAQLTFRQIHKLIVDIGRGLEHCHSRRVLHRDIKPSNIFLTAKRESKLGDFGTGSYLTSKNQDRVGTVYYMAPEIFQGEGASVRSDIYSLGVVAFELLGGERPFRGSSYDELMLAHTSGLPKNLLHLRPEVDKEVARVVVRAMSRDPNKRFQSAREFNQTFAQAVGLAIKPTAPDQVIGRSGRASPVEPVKESHKEPRKEPHKEPEKEPDKRGLTRWFGRKRG